MSTKTNAGAKPRVKLRTVDRSEAIRHMPSRGEAGLTRADIAALLNVSLRTLDNMVGAGQYPRCDFRLPDPEKGDPRWRLATHDAWVRRRAGAGEGGTEET